MGTPPNTNSNSNISARALRCPAWAAVAFVASLLNLVRVSRAFQYCFLSRHHTNLKNHHTNRFCMVTPIVSSNYRCLYQLCYVKLSSTNQNVNLLLVDDPGRVRSQITSVVCQIERFDFDCNMVVTRKVII
jgi:hypothetical protein